VYIVRIVRLRRVRWAWCVARVREMETTLAILVLNPQENKQFEGPRSRWKDPTTMNEWMVVMTYSGFNWLCVG
jgi:hypothetical protein